MLALRVRMCVALLACKYGAAASCPDTTVGPETSRASGLRVAVGAMPEGMNNFVSSYAYAFRLAQWLASHGAVAVLPCVDALGKIRRVHARSSAHELELCRIASLDAFLDISRLPARAVGMAEELQRARRLRDAGCAYHVTYLVPPAPPSGCAQLPRTPPNVSMATPSHSVVRARPPRSEEEAGELGAVLRRLRPDVLVLATAEPPGASEVADIGSARWHKLCTPPLPPNQVGASGQPHSAQQGSVDWIPPAAPFWAAFRHVVETRLGGELPRVVLQWRTELMREPHTQRCARLAQLSAVSALAGLSLSAAQLLAPAPSVVLITDLPSPRVCGGDGGGGGVQPSPPRGVAAGAQPPHRSCLSWSPNTRSALGAPRSAVREAVLNLTSTRRARSGAAVLGLECAPASVAPDAAAPPPASPTELAYTRGAAGWLKADEPIREYLRAHHPDLETPLGVLLVEQLLGAHARAFVSSSKEHSVREVHDCTQGRSSARTVLLARRQLWAEAAGNATSVHALRRLEPGARLRVRGTSAALWSSWLARGQHCACKGPRGWAECVRAVAWRDRSRVSRRRGERQRLLPGATNTGTGHQFSRDESLQTVTIS